MKYQKPEVLVVAAAAVVQGGKGYDMVPDGDPEIPNHTNGSAYEADE